MKIEGIEISQKDIRIILAFFVIMGCIYALLLNVNDYEFSGYYQGVDNQGNVILSGSVIDLPYDLNIPSRFENKYIIIKSKGFGVSVSVDSSMNLFFENSPIWLDEY